jgi:hypothetical protein
MKKAFAVGLAIGALLWAQLALAAPPLNPYSETPTAACESSPMLRAMIRSMFRSGYQFVSMEEQPIAYLVEPEGNYAWGKILFTFCSQPDPTTHATEYCTLTAEINFYDPMGFKIDHLDAGFNMVR